METLITTDIWNWVVCPNFFLCLTKIYIWHNLLAHLCIIPYILWMPPSPYKMREDENFRKQSDVGIGGGGFIKLLISRRGVNFLGKGSKDLPGKWKLRNLNYIHITLKLCKILCLFSKYIFFITVNMSSWLNEFSKKKLAGLGGSILAIFLLHFMYFAT